MTALLTAHSFSQTHACPTTTPYPHSGQMRSRKEESAQSRPRYSSTTYAAAGGGGAVGGKSSKTSSSSSSVLGGFRGPQVHFDVQRGAGEGHSAGRLQSQQERIDDWSSQPQRAFTDHDDNAGVGGGGSGAGGISGGGRGGSDQDDPTSAHALAAMEHTLARVTADGNDGANGSDHERTAAALRAAASFVSALGPDVHLLQSRHESRAEMLMFSNQVPLYFNSGLVGSAARDSGEN